MNQDFSFPWPSEDFELGMIFAEMRMLSYIQKWVEEYLELEELKHMDEDDKYNIIFAAAFESIQDKLNERLDTNIEKVKQNPMMREWAKELGLMWELDPSTCIKT